MDTPATYNIPIPPLARVVVCDSFPTGDDASDLTRPTAGRGSRRYQQKIFGKGDSDEITGGLQ